MAETTATSFADDAPRKPRSDGEPGTEGLLGEFRRGPVLFTLHLVAPDPRRSPREPAEYLVDFDDGAGPHECCRFTADPNVDPLWHGAWDGDEWCGWILDNANRLITGSKSP